MVNLRKEKKVKNIMAFLVVGIVIVTVGLFLFYRWNEQDKLEELTGEINNQELDQQEIKVKTTEEVEPVNENIIKWEDPAMEKCICQALSRETGDVLVDEVKNIEELYIVNGKCSFTIDPVESANDWAGQITTLDDLVYFENLKILKVTNNKITNIEGLREITSLETLRLESNCITDISSLAGLTNLTELNLINNDIIDVSSLAELTNLTHLFLCFNNIEDISSFTKLSKVIWLDVSYNCITNIQVLAELPSIKMLFLSNNKITDYSPVSDYKENGQALLRN